MRTTHFLAVLLFITACSFTLQAQAEMRPVLKNRAGVPPFDVLQEILATSPQQSDNALPKNNASPPHITWLAGADARVQPGLIIANPKDKVFAVRNLGNQLTTSLGTLDYGVRFLHTPILLITGNTDSEAIRLFHNGYKELDPTTRQQLDHLYLPLKTINTEPGKQLTPSEKELIFVEQNVDYQVAQAMDRYKERIKKKRLVVVGSVLDVANYYGKGHNQLFIININGKTDPKKMKKLQLLRTLRPELLKNIDRPRK